MLRIFRGETLVAEKQIISSSCHCINLRRATNAVSQYYDRKLAPSGLTLNQYSILSNIRKIEPCSVTELAEKTRLDRTTLVRNLKPMFAAEWILDEASPGNRRNRLRLTEAGVEKITAAKPMWQEAQAGLEKHIGQSELAALTVTLLELEKLNK